MTDTSQGDYMFPPATLGNVTHMRISNGSHTWWYRKNEDGDWVIDEDSTGFLTTDG